MSARATAAYKAYINSDAWKDVRKRYRRERPWACAVCGAKRGLHLHHRTYLRLGREELDDLIPLCQKHHRQTHLLASGGELWDAHTRIDHSSSVLALPPAGRRATKKRGNKPKKYKPQRIRFNVQQERAFCARCRTPYAPDHPKLRCECGGFIEFVKTKSTKPRTRR